MLETAGESLSGPIFCAYKELHPTVPRTALSSSGFANRFKRLIIATFDVADFTVHGVRRGRMQHADAANSTLSEILVLAGITTESVARLYLDKGRHLA
jgi:hypothetical protein